MPADVFRFVSRWEVAASPERCWQMLEDALRRGRLPWWPAVRVDPLGVTSPAVGDDLALEVRSPLGYRLRVRLTLTEVAPPHVIAATSDGDLAGRGRLEIARTPAPRVSAATAPASGAPASDLVWTWEVAVWRPWMRALSPVLRPLYVLAHREVMRRGERGFARALAAAVEG